MKILFEEYDYNNIENDISEYFADDKNIIFKIKKNESEVLKTKYIGYYYSKQKLEHVIILPKVFLNEKDEFVYKIEPTEEVSPSDLWNENNDEDSNKNKNKLSNDKHLNAFLFESTTAFYMSLKKYQTKFPDSETFLESNVNIIDSSSRFADNTELDYLLSFIDFNKKHNYLFTFIKKVNRQSNKNICWNSTISKILPVIINNKPLYLNTHCKNKIINYDEELIIIFLSILKYEIKEKFKIPLYINENYNILSQKEYNKLKQKGTRVLKKIRYKYFDDILIRLYKLIFAYLKKNEEAGSKKQKSEFLLIKNYELVFQDMVDELISDRDAIKTYKNLKDGKELDHIYKDVSLLSKENHIFNIADSKYYKLLNKIEEKSFAKQFTYAKNIIQYNINIFNEKKDYDDNLHYRDDLTEGYNITPNFFIRGIVNEKLENDMHLKEKENQGPKNTKNLHFKNRLFDRDTLIVITFEIKFLFLLFGYIKKSYSEAERNSVKEAFRKCLIKHLKKYYDFYTFKYNGVDLEKIIKKYFYKLNGKVYKPHKDSKIIFAIEKKMIYSDIITSKEITYKFDKNEFVIITNSKNYLVLDNNCKLEIEELNIENSLH